MIPSGLVSVCSTPWFDCGHMSASVYEAFGRISHVLAAHGVRLRAGAGPRRAADGVAVGESGLSSSMWWWASWRSSRPRLRTGFSTVRVEYISSALHPRQPCSEAPAPGVEHIQHLSEYLAPAPAVSRSPAPGVEHLSPAPPVLPRGDEVTLLFQKTTERRPRLRVHARRTRPLHSAFKAYCRRFGLQESQVRFSSDGLLSPDHSPDQLGLEDGDVIEAEEVYEEDEEEEDDDDDYDEIDGTESRCPAGFWPMRMCRWFPSGNCRQGWGCMFAHSVSELHPQARWGDGF